MLKSCFLVDEAVFGVKNFGVSRVNYVLDYVGILVHFSLCVILLLVPTFRLFEFILIFLFLFAVFPHHILFSYLVETVAHFC